MVIIKFVLYVYRRHLMDYSKLKEVTPLEKSIAHLVDLIIGGWHWSTGIIGVTGTIIGLLTIIVLLVVVLRPRNKKNPITLANNPTDLFIGRLAKKLRR